MCDSTTNYTFRWCVKQLQTIRLDGVWIKNNLDVKIMFGSNKNYASRWCLGELQTIRSDDVWANYKLYYTFWRIFRQTTNCPCRWCLNQPPADRRNDVVHPGTSHRVCCGHRSGRAPVSAGHLPAVSGRPESFRGRQSLPSSQRLQAVVPTVRDIHTVRKFLCHIYSFCIGYCVRLTALSSSWL